MSIHLIGGGWCSEASTTVYGAFVDEVIKAGGRLTYVLQHGTPGGRFEDLLRELGIDHIRRVTIGRERPADPDELCESDGLFICGGVNPVYATALRPATRAIQELIMAGAPYAGFSAGAVVASDRALLGGWTRFRAGREVAICPKPRNEGVDQMLVASGIGLLPFAVDVHGTKWGTVTRAIHAVEAGLIDDCIMVDEDTVAIVNAGKASVRGYGWVYRIRRAEGEARVQVFGHGDDILMAAE